MTPDERARLDRVAERQSAIAAVQSTLAEAVKDLAPRDMADEIARTQKDHVLPKLAQLDERTAAGNEAAGALGALSTVVREALKGKPIPLLILLIGLPFTLLTLAFLVASALGQGPEFIQAVGSLLPNSIGTLEVDADAVNVNPQRP